MSLGKVTEQITQYEIKDFSPGLINSLTDTNIPPGGGDICKNARFDAVGGIKKRKSRAVYNAATLGTDPIMHVDRVYIGSDRSTICVYDTHLYKGSDSLGTFKSLKPDLTENLRYSAVTYKDFYYLFNGTDNNVRTDATNVKDMGCQIPAYAATATEGAAGALENKAYKYQVTFLYDDYQESEPQTGTITVTPAVSKKIELTGIPTCAPDSYEEWLCDFNGTDADTSFIESAQGVSLTFNGTAAIDTAQYKFGVSSLLLDGNSDYVNLPKASWTDFTTTDWTIDCWVRITTDQDSIIIGQYEDANNWWHFKRDQTNGKLLFKFHEAAADKADYEVAWSPSTGTWYHLELSRSGANIQMFIDGTKQTLTETTAITASTSLGNIDASASVGEENAGDFFDGWVDELRVSAGIARHTADFDVATESYASQRDVTDRKIYRTEGDGTSYYLLTTLSDNTTHAYSDNTVDGSLDTTSSPPTANEIPPTAKYSTLHKDRLFLSGNSTNESRVYFSKIASGVSYPDIFPTTNTIDVAEDDGDKITGLAVDPTGQLCVFKRYSLRKIYTEGDPAEDWSVSEVFASDGCVAPYSIAESPYGIFYLSRHGEEGLQVRLFDGQHSNVISDKVSAEINELDMGRVEEAVGHYHGDMYYLSYTYNPDGSDYNDRVLIYDIRRQAWVIDPKNINCFTTWYGKLDRGELYTGDSNAGDLHREETNTYDSLWSVKSDIDLGTFNQTESSGTESDPVITCVDADLDDDVGAQTWTSLSGGGDTWGDYDGELDTWWTGGTYTTLTREIELDDVNFLTWNENLGSNGIIHAYLRFGDTKTACEAASWSGPYATTPADVSGVTSNNWVQIKFHLFTNDHDLVTTPKLFIDDGYMFKLDGDLGDAAESAIAFELQMGQLDCGAPRQVKRFRGLQIDYSSDSAGELNIYYTLDRGSEVNTFYRQGTADTSVDLSTFTDTYTANFPIDAVGRLIKPRIYSEDLNAITIKRVVLLFSAKPPRWV